MRKNKDEANVYSQNPFEESPVFNPFEATDYSQKGRIVIASLEAVEKYEPDSWSINEELFGMKDEPYVKLVGEYWYCGLLVDGKILYPLSEFKALMEKVNPKVLKIENDVMYFKQPFSKRAGKVLSDLEIIVQHIGTEFGDLKDDEIFIKVD